jgi:hypothetical protein
VDNTPALCPGLDHPGIDQLETALSDRRALVNQGIQSFEFDPSAEFPNEAASTWGATPEFGGALTGIFSGWDFSLYASRTYQNRTSTVVSIPEFSLTPLFVTDDDLVWMFGAGANWTFGSWLLKGEIAYLHDLDYTTLVPDWDRCPVPLTVDELPDFLGADPEELLTCIPYSVRALTLPRLDYMVGLEYYGISNLNVAIEVAHRHLFDYDPLLQFLPNYTYEDSIELAVRLTKDLMAERLTLTALGIGIFNNDGHVGSVLRFSADYDVIDALVLSGGYLHFVGSDQVPFNSWQDNNRLFMKIKYSF